MSDTPSAVAEPISPRTPLNSLRWLAILPASLLASWLGRSVGGLFLFLRNPGYPEYLFPLMFLLPSGLAFTFVGAFVAPGYRLAIAICLTALCIIQSLCIHILMQEHPGLTNYMHTIGESLGAMLGVAVLVTYFLRRSGHGLSLPHAR